MTKTSCKRAVREPSLEEPGLPKTRSGGGSWIIVEGTRTTGSGGHPKSPSMAGEEKTESQSCQRPEGWLYSHCRYLGSGSGQGAGGRGRTSERQFQKERVRNPETREENSSRKRSTVRDFFCSNLCDRCDKSLEVVRDKGEPSQETQNLASRESLERRLSLSF